MKTYSIDSLSLSLLSSQSGIAIFSLLCVFFCLSFISPLFQKNSVSNIYHHHSFFILHTESTTITVKQIVFFIFCGTQNIQLIVFSNDHDDLFDRLIITSSLSSVSGITIFSLMCAFFCLSFVSTLFQKKKNKKKNNKKKAVGNIYHHFFFILHTELTTIAAKQIQSFLCTFLP